MQQTSTRMAATQTAPFEDRPIVVREFAKSYGDTTAVRSLDFTVGRGMLYGLIGPDGAGKTTTMRTLVSLLRPDAGSLIVCGHDVVAEPMAVRGCVGYMPQRFSLYPDLSVDQNLTFFADLFGVPPAEIGVRKQRLYTFSRLEPFAKRLAGRLSGGMKQKLALSCTLIHEPDVLVLDEPTTGVDPVSRNEFWTILRELTADGVAILVSTPYMDEALRCDRVLVMHEGRALAEGDPRDLTRSFELPVFAVQDADVVMRDDGGLSRAPFIRGVHSFGEILHVTADPGTSIDEVRAAVAQAFGRPIAVERIDATLEDVFIHLTGDRREH